MPNEMNPYDEFPAELYRVVNAVSNWLQDKGEPFGRLRREYAAEELQLRTNQGGAKIRC